MITIASLKVINIQKFHVLRKSKYVTFDFFKMYIIETLLCLIANRIQKWLSQYSL